MASTKTKLVVGVFVLIGFALAAGAIIWLGLASQFENGQYYAAYFDESVQGLNKDAPVKYRGVSIGRVSRISVAPDATLIEVILKIETDLKPDREMVAQLGSVGITGIMFVELDRQTNADMVASPALEFTPAFPVIPTKPSNLKVFFGDIDDILNQMKALNVPEISDQILATIADIRQSFQEARITALSDRLEKALQSFDRAMAGLSDASDAVGELSRTSSGAMRQVDTAFARFDRLLADNRNRIDGTLDDLSRAVAKLDALVGQVENPNGIAGAVDRLDGAMDTADNLFQHTALLVDDLKRNLGMLQGQTALVLRQMEDASRLFKRSMEQVADQPSLLLFSRPPAARSIQEPESGGP